MKQHRAHILSLALLTLALTGGCSVEDVETPTGTGGEGQELSGTVVIEGSSTVFPISQAVAEAFQAAHSKVRIPVKQTGTGGGFRQFTRGDCDINNASRPIKDGEIAACKENGVEYIELKVAIDGLSVMVNPQNDFCDRLSIAQLRKIWNQDSQVKTWKDVDPSWPDETIVLYGPDTASGTFDYFTEEVCGETGNSRSDYTASTDDNVLVKGISGDKYSLGYFGYAYYIEHQKSLKALAISASDDLETAVLPSPETIADGTYTPLSRPLFIYVNTASLKKPAVREFVSYLLDDGKRFVSEVGYIPVTPEESQAAVDTLKAAISGSADEAKSETGEDGGSSEES